ncbi:MAG: hypothetical protein ACTIJ9_11305 [Aequorivita sp.]
MKKIIASIIIVLIALFLGFFIYKIILAKAHERMPQTETPQELKTLEIDVEKENSGIDIIFYEITVHELKNCHAKLEVEISIFNDSIAASKSITDSYIQSIKMRILNTIINKKCIDSLLIDASTYHSTEKILKDYQYSYPME